MTTHIQWTDETWNPTRGCSVVSPGCVNCYAMKQAHRFSGEGKAYHGLTKQTKAGPQWTGRVMLDEPTLRKPLSWKRPRRIFVNSMSDLFHESLPDEYIDRVFAVMALCPQHTFQVLTKRAERMRRYFSDLFDAAPHDDRRTAVELALWGMHTDQTTNAISRWPLSNVWLGVSVEDQQRADERIPLLLQTPAAVRFISAEPLLGPVDLRTYLDGHEEHGTPFSDPPARTVGGCIGWTPPLDWVIVGGESGPGARNCQLEWLQSIVDQCRVAGVACFVKQLGAQPCQWSAGDELTGNGVFLNLRDRKGGDPNEWPAGFRVREFPEVVQ